jgi:hypothetical protein
MDGDRRKRLEMRRSRSAKPHNDGVGKRVDGGVDKFGKTLTITQWIKHIELKTNLRYLFIHNTVVERRYLEHRKSITNTDGFFAAISAAEVQYRAQNCIHYGITCP